ncbi:MAG: 16S rRNA (cytosine(1402)-N(4))-methyltransferase [Methyloprofundus sp.]|nr:16S rRNA (cytosine(1402)-N(4))-methyltransferase [Methyloprofundus sp.]
MLSTRFTLHSLVTEAHKTIQGYLPQNCISIDATMGNGHDTLFLARHSRKVYAFDIQEDALTATNLRLQKNGFNNKIDPEINLIHNSHEHMTQYIAADEKAGAIMFNLGYLPRGDSNIITQQNSTLAALNQSLDLLSQHGIISILTYPGHAGGKAEMEAVINWYQYLDTSAYAITIIHSIQETPESPRLFLVTPVT